MTPDLPEQALRAAAQFIKNGIEYGYIQMPDADCPDTAHDTLPLIERAIEAIGARSTAAQPAGWKLVPIEPTDTMLEASLHSLDGRLYPQDGVIGPKMMDRTRYAAMLAAAPPAAAQPVEPPYEPIVEVWRGSRKVTVYPPRTVLRSWNSATEFFDAPFSLRSVQEAMDWLYAAPPAASGDSTPPSEPVQGDSIGAPRPEPEAAGQGGQTARRAEYFHKAGAMCSQCGCMMVFDQGEEMTRDHPGDAPAWHCTGCGHNVPDPADQQPAPPPAASQQADLEAE